MVAPRPPAAGWTRREGGENNRSIRLNMVTSFPVYILPSISEFGNEAQAPSQTASLRPVVMPFLTRFTS